MNKPLVYSFVYLGLLCFSAFAQSAPLKPLISQALHNRDGACVFINGASGEITSSDSAAIHIRYTPCSTFKIWNTLIGAQLGIISSVNASFYTWDSIPRFLPAWNKDLLFKEAFQVSCVPAFQILARTIGLETMQRWIDSLHYGDMNLASGIDDFWLPREGKKSIQISAFEQASLIKQLVTDQLPFSKRSREILDEAMLVGKSARGSWYGKTGSGTVGDSLHGTAIGWFVGFVVSQQEQYSFACILKGKGVAGKDAKGVIESILKEALLL